MNDPGHLLAIFVGALLVNNFTLSYVLGLCPFFGVSSRIETALRLGAANIFVMTITSLAATALERGHEVVIVSGPGDVEYPAAATTIDVVSTEEMLAACQQVFDQCDGVIGVAAATVDRCSSSSMSCGPLPNSKSPTRQP